MRASVQLSGYEATDLIFTFIAQGDDPDTGNVEEIDVSSLDIVFVVRDSCNSQMWRGEIGSGITLTGADGEFTVWITDTQAANFTPGKYSIGCTLADANVKTQLFDGTMTILRGNISE